MGVEPTQDRITAPQTVLKTAVVTGPRAAPLAFIFARRSPDGHPEVVRRASSLFLGWAAPAAHE